MELKDRLGIEIQRRRQLMGMTQNILAKRANITRTSIADIERGKANPSLNTLVSIATALGTSLGELLSPETPQENRWIFQPFQGNLLQFLSKELSSGQYKHGVFMVAYAKSSGVDQVTADLQHFKDAGGQLEIFVGIDQRNTTAEALYKLHHLCTKLYVVHDRAFAQTYHPKIYLLSNDSRAWAAIGSNNLTAGGLYLNYEACHIRRLDLNAPSDMELYKGLSTPVEQLVSNSLFLQICSTADIQALVEKRLVSTEGQSRRDAVRGRRYISAAGFGHYQIPKVLTPDQVIPIPGGLFHSDGPEEQVSGGKEHAAEKAPAAEAAALLDWREAGEVGETWWFEMGVSTGGSRNILDLSASAKMRGGLQFQGEKVIPGGVTFFGMDPDQHDEVRDITVIYNGIAYSPSTIKYAPGNSCWRLQLKGHAETGTDKLSQHGVSSFSRHILVFHKVEETLYILETIEENALSDLKKNSVFWATNGSRTDGKAFGRI